MKQVDIQSNRHKLMNSPIKSYLEELNSNCIILTGNFGYILIPKNKELPVKKIFIDKYSFDKEVTNYINLLGKIVVPKISIIGEVNIVGKSLFCFELENIRTHYDRFQSILEISPIELGKLLGDIHTIDFKEGNYMLHGNIHESNFFKDKEGKLGIFDFVSTRLGKIEYDFALLYINSMYNDKFLEKVLIHYKLKDKFNYTNMYKIALQKTIENIKLKRPIKDEGVSGLKQALVKLKNKLTLN